MFRVRDVCRFQEVADADDLFVYRVDRVFVDALDREFGHAVLLLDPDDDVSAADVVYVVCEGAYRMSDLAGVPALLVLYAGVLYRTAVYDIVQIRYHGSVPPFLILIPIRILIRIFILC